MSHFPSSIRRLAQSLRGNHLSKQIARVALPLTLFLVAMAAHAQAGPRRPTAARTRAAPAFRIVVPPGQSQIVGVWDRGGNNGRRVSRFSSSGFMNPDLLVLTPQGAMHRDAAERLGLPGIPITGSPEGPQHE